MCLSSRENLTASCNYDQEINVRGVWCIHPNVALDVNQLVEVCFEIKLVGGDALETASVVPMAGAARNTKIVLVRVFLRLGLEFLEALNEVIRGRILAFRQHTLSERLESSI